MSSTSPPPLDLTSPRMMWRRFYNFIAPSLLAQDLPTDLERAAIWLLLDLHTVIMNDKTEANELTRERVSAAYGEFERLWAIYAANDT